MEEEKKKNLQEEKIEIKAKDNVSDVKNEDTELADTPEATEPSVAGIDKSQTLDSATETIGVTPPNTENVIEEGGGRVVTSWKFDDKMKEDVRELLQSDLSNSVQDLKKDFLIIFGLFASFVTFISINVQVFKNNDNTFELLGICSISLSFIIIFAIIINGIVKNIDKWKDMFNPTFILGIVFLLLGLIFLSLGNSKDSETISKLEQKIAIDSTQIKLLQTDLKTLSNKAKFTDSTIIELKLKVDTVQRKQQSLIQTDNPKLSIEKNKIINQ